MSKSKGASFLLVLIILIYMVFADTIELSGSNSNTIINNIEFLPTTPYLYMNLTIRANVTDNENNQIIWVNFTLESPSNIKYINNINGTQFGDFWNSTHLVINETGIWTWNVTSKDDNPINLTSPKKSGTFTIVSEEGVESPAGAGGGSEGARGGGCDVYADTYNKCFYIDLLTSECKEGCLDGYVCNNEYRNEYRCIIEEGGFIGKETKEEAKKDLMRVIILSILPISLIVGLLVEEELKKKKIRGKEVKNQ